MPIVLHKSFLPGQRKVLQVTPTWKTRTDLQKVLALNVAAKKCVVRNHERGNEENVTSAHSKKCGRKVFNERFEKSMKMFQENQKMKMAQTASLLTGFKALMKDLVKE